MLTAGIFETKFPLHKVRGGLAQALRAEPLREALTPVLGQGEEDLKKKWARWRNLARRQPIDDIR